MKHLHISLLYCLLGLFIGTTLSLTQANNHKDKLIKAYEQYYKGTEELLDDLDSAYNWVDGYDNYEYYSSKAKIDSLTNNIH